MRGGYLIIDLNNKNFEIGVGMVVDGIYERIENTRKPVRFSNFVLEGNEIRDLELNNIGIVGSTFEAGITRGDLNVTIVKADTDVVTIKAN